MDTTVVQYGESTSRFRLMNKRLLHDIFHIGPCISLRLPYQGRQQS